MVYKELLKAETNTEKEKKQKLRTPPISKTLISCAHMDKTWIDQKQNWNLKLKLV